MLLKFDKKSFNFQLTHFVLNLILLYKEWLKTNIQRELQEVGWDSFKIALEI